MPQGPDGRWLFGTVKVGTKGQIVIPKEARDLFDIKPGDVLMVGGDEKTGLAIFTNRALNEMFMKVLGGEEK